MRFSVSKLKKLQAIQFAKNFDPRHRPLNIRLAVDIFSGQNARSVFGPARS